MREESSEQSQKRYLSLVFNLLGFWLVGCGCFDIDFGGGGGGCAFEPEVEFEANPPSFTPGTTGMGEGGFVFALLDPLPGSGGGSCVETLRVTTHERVDMRCLSTQATAIGSLADGSLLLLDQDGHRVVQLRPNGDEVAIATGIATAADLSVSAYGRFGLVVTSSELLALSFDEGGGGTVIAVLALDSSDHGSAVTGWPLALLDQDDQWNALQQEGAFWYTAQSTSNSILGAVRIASGSAVLQSQVPIVNPACPASASDVQAGLAGFAILDASCGAIYRAGFTQDTSATLVLGAIASPTTVFPARRLAWSFRTGEYLALAERTEIVIDFAAGTTETSGSFSTAASAQVGGYAGNRIWIAGLALDTASAPTLSTFDPETRTLTNAVYVFAVPGAVVRDLAYRDRPPSVMLSGWPSPVKANQQAIVQLRAVDPDGDALSQFTMEDGPSGAEFVATGIDGTFRWTPTCADAGNHQVRIVATAASWTGSGVLRLYVPDCE